MFHRATFVAAASTAAMLAAAGAPSSVFAAAPAPDDPQVFVAAIRDRGLPCERVVSTEPDATASLPEREAWIVRCDQARYRVIFEGDTGARIDELP